MLCIVSNPARPVNLPPEVTLPTPAGSQPDYDGPAPTDVDRRIFTDLPPGLTGHWLPDSSGVTCAEPLPLQFVYRGRGAFLEMQPVTLLVNGRLRIGSASHTYRHDAIYRVDGRWEMSRYVYEAEKNLLPPGLAVYVHTGAMFTIWERIYESHWFVYQLFEDLADGLDLDPLQLRATFRSRASAEVFHRRFPEYETLSRCGRGVLR
ncbi:MAG: hypothetical protein KC441_05340 [Anaerolineales bacterium]|nr:hypothetical protein [Anaerolineales bacterium]